MGHLLDLEDRDLVLNIWGYNSFGWTPGVLKKIKSYLPGSKDAISMKFNKTSPATIKFFARWCFDSEKDEVNKLREKNTKLKYSLEFSQGEMDFLKQTVQQQGAQIKYMLDMTVIASAVRDGVRSFEDFSKTRNLRTYGLLEWKFLSKMWYNVRWPLRRVPTAGGGGGGGATMAIVDSPIQPFFQLNK